MGKILAGIQVAPAHEQAFEHGLEQLGYPFVEETDNQVYKDFLVDHDDDEEDEILADDA